MAAMMVRGTRSTTVTLVFNKPEFTMTVTPSPQTFTRVPQTVVRGTYTLSISNTNFTGTVSGSVSGLPSGVSLLGAGVPIPVSPGSTATKTLNLYVYPSSAAGTYTLTLTGTGGPGGGVTPNTKSTTATLIIN